MEGEGAGGAGGAGGGSGAPVLFDTIIPAEFKDKPYLAEFKGKPVAPETYNELFKKFDGAQALRLRQQLDSALAAYRSEARNAANRGVVTAAPAQREQRSVSGS